MSDDLHEAIAIASRLGTRVVKLKQQLAAVLAELEEERKRAEESSEILASLWALFGLDPNREDKALVSTVKKVRAQFAAAQQNHKYFVELHEKAMRKALDDLDALRELCAAVYQLCGAIGVPIRFLDALSAATSGEPFDVDGLLPYTPTATNEQNEPHVTLNEMALKAELLAEQNRHVEFMVTGGPVVMASEYDALKAERDKLREHVKFAEHKVDQHLQGQYNHAPYPALRAALSELRAALTPKEPK